MQLHEFPKADMERAVIAQALVDTASQILDEDNPKSIKSCLDRYFQDLHLLTGQREFALRIGEDEVGRYEVLSDGHGRYACGVITIDDEELADAYGWGSVIRFLEEGIR